MKKKGKSRNIDYTNYVSSKLGFSISIPSNWRVNADRLETEEPNWEEVYKTFQQTFPDSAMTLEDFKKQTTEAPRKKEVPAEEAHENILKELRAKVIKIREFKKIYEKDRKQAYRAFFKKLLGEPTEEEIEELATRDLSADEAYTRLMADPETFLVNFVGFKEQYEWEQEQQRRAEKRMEELAQMEVGYFEASPVVKEAWRIILNSSMSILQRNRQDGLYHAHV